MSSNCIQLQLLSKGSLARQGVLALDIAVNHDNGGYVIVEMAHYARECRLTSQLTGSFSPVTGDVFLS